VFSTFLCLIVIDYGLFGNQSGNQKMCIIYRVEFETAYISAETVTLSDKGKQSIN